MEQGIRTLTNTDLFTHGTTKLEQLGARGVTADGRRFVYVQADASAGLAAGQLGVAAAANANAANQSLASNSLTAVGTKTLVVSVAGAIAADAYADGLLIVRDGTGKGQTLRVNGNTAAAGAGTITVSLADGVVTALSTADTKIDLLAPYAGVVASTTAATPRGVPLVTLAAAEYGWVQTHGIAAVLSNGAIAKAAAVKQSTAVAGAVAATAAATDFAIGIAPELTVDTKYTQIKLSID